MSALALVTCLLVAGETAASLFHLPVPGAALGLLGLAALLAARGGPDPTMERLFDGVAPHAPILFVPMAVGVVASREALALFWAHLAVAVVVGTAATLVVTGLCAQALLRRTERTTTP